ncbi:SpoVG family protein [bacterium]|nr:septation protein spoVG [bacterium]MBU3956132.1 SpoVG family protein [bacterium]MBU4133965.1 SpoVG family protein [bacterium]
MKVTDVVIRMSKGSSKIKAFAVVAFDNDFTVNAFKVVDGPNGLFVGSPSQKGADGKFYNTIRMKRDSGISSEVTEKVLAKYNETVGASGNDTGAEGQEEDVPPEFDEPA